MSFLNITKQSGKTLKHFQVQIISSNAKIKMLQMRRVWNFQEESIQRKVTLLGRRVMGEARPE